MSILLLVLSLSSFSQAAEGHKTAKKVESSPVMHCKMKGVASEAEVMMDAAGKFVMKVTFRERSYLCKMDPLEITKRGSVAFSNKLDCDPKSIPEEYTSNLNKDLEWLIEGKKMEFFYDAGEPAIACKTIKYDKKQAALVLETLKKKLPPLEKD